MSSPSSLAPAPQDLPVWAKLTEAASVPIHLRDLLAQDPARATRMNASAPGLFLDYSRQRVNDEIFALLTELAETSGVEAARDAMFSGASINTTEGRAVLHVALRGSGTGTAGPGSPVAAFVAGELERLGVFADAIRSGSLKGYGGESITDVVNIGIGGSDLGPRMVCEGLEPFASANIRLHFVSNPDPWNMDRVFARCNPARTLFIVSSKTFTTQETLTNAHSARVWLAQCGCPAEKLAAQMVAVSADPARAVALGFLAEQTFHLRDWVGGRYSLWSAIGLPIMLAIGPQGFGELLAGAHALDEHFSSAPLAENLPVLLALLGIWNSNFLGADTQLIVPYAAQLARLPAYIQQLDMESNGKSVRLQGGEAETSTGAVVWGGMGIDGQHAYFQLVHQGSHLIPVDFIGVLGTPASFAGADEHLRVVHANLIAQARALSLGRDLADTRAELEQAGLPESEVNRLAPHRVFRGNVPSSLLWLEQVTPYTLGALIALYEHKIFVQATIWGINAFDQWGVELGKKVVNQVYPALLAGKVADGVDAATELTMMKVNAAAKA